MRKSPDPGQNHRLGRMATLRLWVLTFAGVMLMIAATDAATVAVTNTNNGLAGSLRQIVQDAAPGDTQGPAGSTKKILVRAIGPSLAPFGITDALANPILEIHDASGATVATNNDWKSTQVGGLITGDQLAEIRGSGVAPPRSAARTTPPALASSKSTSSSERRTADKNNGASKKLREKNIAS
jgi:hypothetical protein